MLPKGENEIDIDPTWAALLASCLEDDYNTSQHDHNTSLQKLDPALMRSTVAAPAAEFPAAPASVVKREGEVKEEEDDGVKEDEEDVGVEEDEDAGVVKENCGVERRGDAEGNDEICAEEEQRTSEEKEENAKSCSRTMEQIGGSSSEEQLLPQATGGRSTVQLPPQEPTSRVTVQIVASSSSESEEKDNSTNESKEKPQFPFTPWLSTNVEPSGRYTSRPRMNWLPEELELTSALAKFAQLALNAQTEYEENVYRPYEKKIKAVQENFKYHLRPDRVCKTSPLDDVDVEISRAEMQVEMGFSGRDVDTTTSSGKKKKKSGKMAVDEDDKFFKRMSVFGENRSNSPDKRRLLKQNSKDIFISAEDYPQKGYLGRPTSPANTNNALGATTAWEASLLQRNSLPQSTLFESRDPEVMFYEDCKLPYLPPYVRDPIVGEIEKKKTMFGQRETISWTN